MVFHFCCLLTDFRMDSADLGVFKSVKVQMKDTGNVYIGKFSKQGIAIPTFLPGGGLYTLEENEQLDHLFLVDPVVQLDITGDKRTGNVADALFCLIQ